MRYLLILLVFLTITPAYADSSVLNRIMETKVLRCGYLPYEPFVIKDANTGELSGLTYDVVNQMAARAGLKVEWVQEVNIDQIVPAIDGSRIDVFCIPCTPDENWAKVIDFVGEQGALPYYIYVPNQSTLSREQLATARFVEADGYALTAISREVFPHMQSVALPQTTSQAEIFDQLYYDKADAVINENITAAHYMQNNPGRIRRFSETPVIAMRMFLVSKKDDGLMSDFMARTFNVNAPENAALFQNLLVKYNVPQGSLLTGAECPELTDDNGHKICGTSAQSGQ